MLKSITAYKTVHFGLEKIELQLSFITFYYFTGEVIRLEGSTLLSNGQ